MTIYDNCMYTNDVLTVVPFHKSFHKFFAVVADCKSDYILLF